MKKTKQPQAETKEICIDEKVPAYLIAETYGPKFSRKNDGPQKAFRDALCRNKKFKKDIQILQTAFPPVFWAKRIYRDDERRQLENHISLEWEVFLKRISKKYLSKQPFVHSAYQLHPHLNKAEMTLSDFSQYFYLPCPSVQDPFRVAAERIYYKWGLDETHGYDWLAWLIQNWDLSKHTLPPDEPNGIFIPTLQWEVRWYYGMTPEGRHCRVTLRQGVSQRQALQLIKVLLPQLKPTIKHNGAPRVTEKEIKIIHGCFEQYKIPNKPPHGLLKTIKEEVHIKTGVNRKTIGIELQKYREAKGHKIKKYWPREIKAWRDFR